MWFDDWNSLIVITAKAAIGFVALVFLIRIGGKRLLAKLNAFDVVIAFTVGSLFSTMIISSKVTVAEGLVALTVLLGLSALASFLVSRYRIFQKVIRSQPTLLFYQGRPLYGVLKQERIAVDELHYVVRNHGISDLQKVKAIVLETDGAFSVLTDLEDLGQSPTGALEVSGINIPHESTPKQN